MYVCLCTKFAWLITGIITLMFTLVCLLVFSHMGSHLSDIIPRTWERDSAKYLMLMGASTCHPAET